MSKIYIHSLLSVLALSLLSGCSTLEKPKIDEQPSVHIQTKTSQYLVYRPLTVSNDTTQIGRYQTLVNQAQLAQENPLFAVAQFQFSRHVKTIGEAVNQALLNTGYRLVAESKLPPAVVTVLKQPLPLSQRKLGPIRIVDALNILVGKQVYSLMIDPVHRLVTFKLNDDYAQFSDSANKQNREEK